jgi:hypothetical protein
MAYFVSQEMLLLEKTERNQLGKVSIGLPRDPEPKFIDIAVEMIVLEPFGRDARMQHSLDEGMDGEHEESGIASLKLR